MKFSEYYKCFDDIDETIRKVHECAEEYIKKLMLQQTISIGKPSTVTFDKDNLSVSSNEDSLQVEINSYKSGTSLCLDVSINDRIHEVKINPIYFKPENIKNYMRECEIGLKKQFSEIRKVNK